MEQRTGIAAIASIVAAIGSYVLTCTGSPIWGLVVAIVSVPLGFIGFVLAASPKVSGGILSIAAMVLGALAIIVAVLGMFGALVT